MPFIEDLGQSLHSVPPIVGALVIAATSAISIVVTMLYVTWNTSRQIEAQRQLEDERRARRFNAARAVLQVELSEFCNYVGRCVATLLIVKDALKKEVPGDILIEDVEPVPRETVSNLLYLIEQADDECGEAVATILHWYQVQQARYGSLIGRFSAPEKFGPTEIVVEQNVFDALTDCVQLNVVVSAAFDFARGRSDRIWVKPYPKEMLSSAVMKFHLEHVLPDYVQQRLIENLCESQKSASGNE